MKVLKTYEEFFSGYSAIYPLKSVRQLTVLLLLLLRLSKGITTGMVFKLTHLTHPSQHDLYK